MAATSVSILSGVSFLAAPAAAYSSHPDACFVVEGLCLPCNTTLTWHSLAVVALAMAHLVYGSPCSISLVLLASNLTAASLS